MYGAIITVVFIESSEQARIRRQQYLQQYKMPNEIHENVVIKKTVLFQEKQQMTNLTLTPCTLIHLKVKQLQIF